MAARNGARGGIQFVVPVRVGEGFEMGCARRLKAASTATERRPVTRGKRRWGGCWWWRPRATVAVDGVKAKGWGHGGGLERRDDYEEYAEQY
ncbi:hypothetical protein SESBI_32809 [Sesbania bispinosa]|nr:hypothetical protein SESBI_32809 [Sesbania bispinosa]